MRVCMRVNEGGGWRERERARERDRKGERERECVCACEREQLLVPLLGPELLRVLQPVDHLLSVCGLEFRGSEFRVY